MNQQDTEEAIKEAKRLSSTTVEYKDILLTLELFYMLGQKAAAVADLERTKAKLQSAKDLQVMVTGE